jgi:hypothetical protein
MEKKGKKQGNSDSDHVFVKKDFRVFQTPIFLKIDFIKTQSVGDLSYKVNFSHLGRNQHCFCGGSHVSSHKTN